LAQLKIQMLIGIGGGFHNIYRDLRRGDVVDIDGTNIDEASARRYIGAGYAVEVHGRPLDARDLPPAYRTPG
jgi:hypothetical protein